MQGVVITGAPGTGKTTLIAELVRRGHRAVSDSAREVIAERLAKGLAPRPDAAAFAREVYARDVTKYDQASRLDGLVFFERTALESHAMLCDALRGSDVEPPCPARDFGFSSPVFVLPPWPEIYTTDSERDHTFDHALRVHETVVPFYLALGYSVCELPLLDPARRASYVLGML